MVEYRGGLLQRQRALEVGVAEKCGDVEVTDACAKDEVIGHHGRWLFYGEYLGWIKAGIEPATHREVLDRCPWYLFTTPPLESESKVEFQVRRTREQHELRRSLLESVEMADEDELLKSTRAPKLKRSSRHFFNIHKQPDHETKYDSNAA